ncbi:transporter associated domain-containing protein [Sulfitobacter donghicola]|uniref:Uncharacterized protein n=1 Tax=Sulfitobacter donghicola DSW-25 = KCTC 12864 = JCM 14565 TaxID=1300350 RepID=A0A073IDQ6_9RHOB|nr:transporter associated domain-containing protein [Sulfitobacter donghicola]KEJ87710.1 hypothetical protein DSW25_08955 [Sulfitobacter donghicola DSW-25 = KCTC 12864 = JCM 14565]
MHKPQGRLTDVFNLPDDESGEPRTVLMLDQLTHVPETGDVLQVANRKLTIAQVDGRRIRNCLTGWKMAGRGSVAVLVNEPTDALRPFAQRPDWLLVTWTPKDELPWHFTTDDLPAFTQLNIEWNAHPNDVGLKIEHNGQTLLARMRPNPYVYRQYENIPEIVVCFKGCAQYRVTPVNDHGWYGGQCRFSGLAPSWAEFYEISGDTRDDMESTPWNLMKGSGTRHFHFYLRDEALEVKAQDWSFDAGSGPSI